MTRLTMQRIRKINLRAPFGVREIVKINLRKGFQKRKIIEKLWTLEISTIKKVWRARKRTLQTIRTPTLHNKPK